MSSDAAFTKLFASIIHSSIWSEPDHVRLVWVTMLAMADSNGYVGAAVPGLASAAKVTLAQVEDALERFQKPDPYSRNQRAEGRRIEHAPRGWKLINYDTFRKAVAAESEKKRKRDWWRDNRGKTSETSEPLAETSDPRHRQKAEAEAEAESKNSEASSPSAIPDKTRFAVPEVTIDDVAREWHVAAPFGTLHQNAGWASDFNDIAITINSHPKIRPANRVRVLQKLCLWVWRDPEGPHVSSRLKKVDPRKIAKRCATDIESAVASEWVARWLEGLEQEQTA